MGTTSSVVSMPQSAGNSEVKQMIVAAQASLSDEQLHKLIVQLEYHARKKHDDLPGICRNLLEVAKPPPNGWKCPTRRFGRTEVQMPIITVGGVRLQQTWAPDNLPITNTNISKDCQNNLVGAIKHALSMGINHFETARFYGTSELQFADALSTMIDAGEVRREDVIVQTKVKPCATNEELEKLFAESWKHMQKIGYIDLFSFHGVSSLPVLEYITRDGGNMGVANRFKEEGKIRHVGFSTHGTPKIIKAIIETDKFDYVNLHYHYFGSYHASGYDNGEGETGNLPNVALAKEKDMGVFVISPFDKGGKLYKPTEKVCELVGTQMSPMIFAAHHLWNQDVDTISVGVAKKSDFDEVVYAARFADDEDVKESLNEEGGIEERLLQAANEALGEEWVDQYWNEMPDMFHENSGGVAAGHILWCYNLVKSFGMIEFAQERYASLEAASKAWKDKESFEVNTGVKEWSFNPGKCWEEGINFEKLHRRRQGLLHDKQNYQMKLILKDAHMMLTGKRKYSDKDKEILGYGTAYNMQTVEDYPGWGVTVVGVVIQNLSKGLCGAGGGKNSKASKKFLKQAERLRSYFAN